MTKQELSKKPPWFLNFFGFIFWGVFCLTWFAHHTDWLPIIGNLLGMGGIFAWIGFLFGMITDARKKQLQEGLDDLLNGWSSFKVLVALALATSLLASFYGSIQFESKEVANTHYLELADEEVRLKAGEEVRALVRTGWHTRALSLKVPGLPKGSFRVKPFRRTEIKVPEDLYRPLVLIWPDHLTTQYAINFKSKLEVILEREGQKSTVFQIDNYQGNPLWLGCGDDVPVPRDMLDLRKLKLSLKPNIQTADMENTLIRWSRAKSLVDDYRPQNNDRLKVVVHLNTGGTFNKDEVHVIRVDNQRERTQLEEYVEVIEISKKVQRVAPL